MLAVNAAADQEAGRQASKRNSGALLQCRRHIVSFLDNRAVQVQQALSARYVLWHDLLKSAQARPKLGCKPPSRVRLVQHARDFLAHSFHVKGSGLPVQAHCGCGLALKASWSRPKIEACLALPCTVRVSFIDLGVHPSHDVTVHGNTLRCSRCRAAQSVSSFVQRRGRLGRECR